MNSLTDMYGISKKSKKLIQLMPIGISFFLVEVFAFAFLSLNLDTFSLEQLWPLAFGLLWAVVLTCLVRIFPGRSARIVYAVIYLAAVIYAGFQTGYYIMFSEMMWLSEFRYASEGADYVSVLFHYPVGWWVGICALIILGILVVWKFPTWKTNRKQACMACAAAAFTFAVALCLPKIVSLRDGDEARSDYKRALSAEAAYEEMFNVHRLYEVCGLYQTLAKDIYANEIIPLTPGYIIKQQSAHAEVDAYFSKQIGLETNQMTGILSGKNIVLVLMESLDDWMVGEDTPTICRLMEEGINFTRFYTPVYGGIRTFNSEFCMNTGSFLSSTGGYAFHYVTNAFDHSLPSLARREGYSTMTFHFNSPEFYSRGEFSAAMGYDAYIWYANYLEWGDEELNRISEMVLNTDDQILFDNEGLNDLFFREGGPTMNFIISNAAHLPYKYNEQVSQFGLEKYPEYYSMTGNEETDCAKVKARLLDDFFARLLKELEENGQLEDTVIIGISDHYTYGYEDKESLLDLSGVQDMLLLERTPCFIWSADLEPIKVDKVLNTSDFLPTLLNLLGVESEYTYIGHDAFDDRCEGFVPFSDGSWISGNVAYDAGTKKLISIDGTSQTVTAEFQAQMNEKVREFIRINNLILETDYYKE